MNRAIILMSGGLDSVAALGILNDKYDIDLALTFDYGQKSSKQEIAASQKICKFYNIKHEIIELNWLKAITKTSLVGKDKVPDSEFGTKQSAEKVWVPNRNALFLNIAASYADSYGQKFIIFGANKDEGNTFPDNTKDFRERMSDVFEFSTLVKPKIVAPLINYSKNDIVRIAVEKGVPLEYLWSCYNGGEKHCGKCESCNHLKQALINNPSEITVKVLKILFDDEN